MSHNKSSKKQSRHKRRQSPWPLVILMAGGMLLIIGVVFAFNKPAKPAGTIEGAGPSSIPSSGSPSDSANGSPSNPWSGSASLSVDQEEIDLGDVRLGESVQVSFQITNIGDQTLRFTEAPYIELKAGC